MKQRQAEQAEMNAARDREARIFGQRHDGSVLVGISDQSDLLISGRSDDRHDLGYLP